MIRWHQKNIWKSLGFTQFADSLNNHSFKKELCKSFLIILFWEKITETVYKKFKIRLNYIVVILISLILVVIFFLLNN